MVTSALPLQEPWKLSVAEVVIAPLPVDWTRRFRDVMPLTLPLPLELIMALAVVKLPSVTAPEPFEVTFADCVASPESTLTTPLPVLSIAVAGVVKLPRTTAPEPPLDTSTFTVASSE
jgi:hypothetical protein